MTFPCCKNTQRMSRFFKKRKPVHGQKVIPGVDPLWPNEKVQPLSHNNKNSNNNILTDDSIMTSSTSNSTPASVIAPPPYKEKSESLKSLKSFEIVPPATHDHR